MTGKRKKEEDKKKKKEKRARTVGPSTRLLTKITMMVGCLCLSVVYGVLTMTVY